MIISRKSSVKWLFPIVGVGIVGLIVQAASYAASSSTRAATIRTTAGDIRVTFAAEAPRTSAAFIENCRRGVYNNMALSESSEHYLYLFGELADGSSKSVHVASVGQRENNNGLQHERGTLALGVTGTPAVDSYELYFCRSTCNTFDGLLTVFATVTDGMSVIDDIATGAAASRIGGKVTIIGIDVE